MMDRRENRCHFINFIKHEKGIIRFRPPQSLDNASGQGADVVRRLAAYFRFVVYPPSDMRTNLRSSARAMEWPSDVLPVPGGPTKHKIGPLESGLSFAHGKDIQ